MPRAELENSLNAILSQYGESFGAKVFGEESVQEDDLMLVFGLTQIVKAGNKQYWGRELGMCWQKLIAQLCRSTRTDYSGPIREGADEICDLVVGDDAIDTKYRIGSGDSGTLKKFRHYADRLNARRKRPVLLILRTDNLAAAIGACRSGGWIIFAGNDAYSYIQERTRFDLRGWLVDQKGTRLPKATS